MTDQVKKGKLNRAAGKRFELKVRADLESKGWIVFRNSNDVEFEELPDETGTPFTQGEFKQTTGHWNPYTRTIMMHQSGFPDFICIVYSAGLVSNLKINPIKIVKKAENSINRNEWHVVFVECKGGDEKHKYLSAKEKEKVEWIKKELKIPVFIANKGDKRGEIKYESR